MFAYSPGVVLALLDHNPTLRVYQFMHPDSRVLCYAVFEVDPEHDPLLGQLLATATLLCADGKMTAAGAAWVVQYGRRNGC